MPHGKETKRHSNSCLIDYANASSQKWGKQRKQTMPGSLGDVGLCWRTNEGNLSHSIMKGRAKSQQKPIKSGKGPLCKILLLGNPTDGQKTFVDGVIDHGFTKSCGLDWTVKTISVRGQSIRLQFYHPICDQCHLGSSYYRGPDGFIIFYDITNQESFGNAAQWLKNVEKFAREDPPRLLIGNKSDLDGQRAIDRNTAEQLADELGISFTEHSCKSSLSLSNPVISCFIDDVILQQLRNARIFPEEVKVPRKDQCLLY